jgi:hypothetical protein
MCHKVPGGNPIVKALAADLPVDLIDFDTLG